MENSIDAFLGSNLYCTDLAVTRSGKNLMIIQFSREFTWEIDLACCRCEQQIIGWGWLIRSFVVKGMFDYNSVSIKIQYNSPVA
jgi:hypothetical protein